MGQHQVNEPMPKRPRKGRMRSACTMCLFLADACRPCHRYRSGICRSPLEAIAGGDPRQRRLQVLQRIAQQEPLQLDQSEDESPEALIRADRAR